MPIDDASEVTPQWLTEKLRSSGALPQGEVAGVRRANDNSTSATIVRLELEHTDDAPRGAPRRLLLKIARPDPDQRIVGNQGRRNEVDFHTRIAGRMNDPPVVRCHDAAYSQSDGGCHLLLDDLSATHYTAQWLEPPPLPGCHAIIDSLAAFHAFWWDHPELAVLDELPTKSTVSEYIASVRGAYTDFAAELAGDLPKARRAVYDQVLETLPRLWERTLGGGPLTLIHGDLHLLNVLLPRDPRRDRAVLIDWQFRNVSFAGEDLANLMAYNWTTPARRRLERGMVLRYHEALEACGVEGYSLDDCWRDYRLAIAVRVLFMPVWQLLGGMPRSQALACLNRAFAAYHDLGCEALVG